MKEFFENVYNKIYEFLRNIKNWYVEFLRNTMNVNVPDEKGKLYFFLTIGAGALILFLLVLIFVSIGKNAKAKKLKKKKETDEAKVEDAIQVLEENAEKEVEEPKKEDKPVEPVKVEAKPVEKVVVEDIPFINASTVDQAAPAIEHDSVKTENVNKVDDATKKEQEKLDKKPKAKKVVVPDVKPEDGEKEVKKAPAKKATTAAKKPTSSKPKSQITIERKEEAKAEEKQPEKEIDTVEFLTAALEMISDEYDKKYNTNKKSEEEKKAKPAKAKASNEEAKPSKLTEEVKVEPDIVVTSTKVEEYDPKKHTKEILTQKDIKNLGKKEEPLNNTKGKYTISQEGIDFRYRLKASNGENLFTSEPYISEASARKGIVTLKNQIAIANIDVVEDKHGLFSFRLMTKQGRCLGTSANYTSKANAENAVESFKRFSETERIELEETKEHYEVEEYKNDVELKDTGKYKVFERDEKFYYQLIASNGRVIASSNAYSSKDSCLEGYKKFVEVVYDGQFLIFRDKNYNFQFKLYNKQKRLIIAGEVYDDKQRALAVVDSIKKFAKNAKYVEDDAK